MTQAWLLKQGTIVNPLQSGIFTGDMRMTGGTIDDISESIEQRPGDKVVDATGKWVMPGLVDMHVHISRSPVAHHMLVKAGVTTALDLASMPDEMTEGFLTHGAGLTLGFLYPLVPGKTLSGNDPSVAELEVAISHALRNGALGVKILGGHYPLTGTATRNAVELAHRRQCWIAVHAGTVETPGDIEGLEELVRIAGAHPVHIAHVNSYCRGSGNNSPLDEARRAMNALQTVPHCRSESYLALINGTSGKLDPHGIPQSHVTRRCLLKGGYTADIAGIKKAIHDGWAKVNVLDRDKHNIIFPEPDVALRHYMELNGELRLSFPVNAPLASIPLAIAKDTRGQFIVDALATDGGEIPRNITLHQGLCLVHYGALTPNELALKACWTPACLLGLKKKGGLVPSADADVIVVDPLTSIVKWAFIEGCCVLENGNVRGTRGRFVTSEEGLGFFESKSIPCISTAPTWLSMNANENRTP